MLFYNMKKVYSILFYTNYFIQIIYSYGKNKKIKETEKKNG